MALFSTRLWIDKVPAWLSDPAILRLLAITIPLTIAAVAVLGCSLEGMTVAGAVFIDAPLPPTDPVLAGGVQVGPPLEGVEHIGRFALASYASGQIEFVDASQIWALVAFTVLQPP